MVSKHLMHIYFVKMTFYQPTQIRRLSGWGQDHFQIMAVIDVYIKP